MIVMTTGGAPTAWIDARDIASVAIWLLLNRIHVGEALTLTGPEGLTLAQVAARISEIVGHPVKFVEESTKAAEDRM
ncbi:hypothetical protein ACTJJ7_11915 [Phyllobacterium sp. 22229]|uniref:Uncharacterized protein n=1 Tax=Agrobacterium radiobacter TaxID=362 RepID=A0ABD5LPY1_AGRRD